MISQAIDSSTRSFSLGHLKSGFMKMKVGPTMMRLTKALSMNRMKKVTH